MKARAALVAAVLVAVAGIVVSMTVVDDGWWAASWVGYPIVGAAILWRIPGNRIGRLLLVIGVAWGVSNLCFALLTVQVAFPGAIWIEMMSAILGTTAFLAMVLVTILFPGGEAKTQATRALAGVTGVIWVMITAAELVDPAPKEITGVTSPVAISALSPFTGWLIVEGFVIVPALIVLALISLVTRWLRSRGVERLQYQWFCCSLIVVVLVLAWFELAPASADGPIAAVVAVLVFNLIPAAIGFAVTRYRLYEIDRIVSRTVSYLLVVGLLAAVYVGGFLLITETMSLQSDLAVASATLAVAGLFNPVRRRIQRAVDRRFNRSRYDMELVVEEFSSSLRDRVDPDGVVTSWVGVVSDTMQPSRLGVWMRDRGVSP